MQILQFFTVCGKLLLLIKTYFVSIWKTGIEQKHTTFLLVHHIVAYLYVITANEEAPVSVW